jgi:hypothetical protein
MESTLKGDIEVSSIHCRHLFGTLDADETVVFFRRDGYSENIGRYDDHDRVVDEMKQKYNATVKS